jgi:hypothetical protein
MVRRALKPSLRAASCCSVEVVNGGAGLRLRCLRSTFATVSVPWAACSIVRRTSSADCAEVTVNCSTFVPRYSVSRALNVCAACASPDFCASASTVQYSRGLNAAISSSRSQIIRSAGLCTRPADAPDRPAFFQSSGDRLKPTR